MKHFFKLVAIFALFMMVFAGISCNQGNNTDSPTEPAQTYRILIISGQNGSISVDKNPTAEGETVTVTATPNDGYRLASISVTTVSKTAVSVAQNGNTATFKMPAENVNVRPSFEMIPNSYSITISATNGSCVADKSGEVEVGTTVTLSMTPDNGYKIGLDGIKISYEDEEGKTANVQLTEVTEGSKYSFVMPEGNVTVKAVFKSASDTKYSITKDDSATENGSFFLDCNEAVEGQIVEFYVSPLENYKVDKITITYDDGTVTPELIYGNEYSFVMPAADVTIKVTFMKLPTYTFDFAEFSNGILQMNKKVSTQWSYIQEGKDVLPETEMKIVIKKIDTGYEFDTLTIVTSDNKPVEYKKDGSDFIFTMPASNITITMTLKKKSYKVTISDEITNGTVVSNSSSVVYGDTVSLTVTPAETYELTEITVSTDISNADVIDVALQSDGKWTFTMPYYDVIVSAKFTKPATVKSQADSLGDIVLSDGTAIAYENLDKMSVTQKKKAVAIIFYKGTSTDTLGEKLLGIGLSKTNNDDTFNIPWCKNWGDGVQVQGYKTKLTSIICTPNNETTVSETMTFTGDLDGSDNWAALKSDLGENDDTNQIDNYPAWKWINSYAQNLELTGELASGWYMPSLAELCFVSLKYEMIDAVMKSLDFKGFNEWADYVSSSQCDKMASYVWAVKVKSGEITYNDSSSNYKAAPRYVCAIKEF